MRRLRELDPTTDLIYLGNGRWILGRVRPHAIRRKKAERMLEIAFREAQKLGATKLDHRAWSLRVNFAELARQGFAPIESYDFQGEPDGRVVRDLERALWGLHHDRGDRMLVEAADGDRERAKVNARKELLDDARAREASRILRHPVSTISPGMPTNGQAA